MKMGKGRETDKGDKKEQPGEGERRCWRVGSRGFKEAVVQMCLVQVRGQGRLKVSFGFYKRGVLFVLEITV